MSDAAKDAANKRHFGVSLWRDLHEPNHWVLRLPGRWLFHLYARSGKRFYVTRLSRWHLNYPYPEFRRLPI